MNRFTFVSALIASFLLTELPQTQSWAQTQMAHQTSSKPPTNSSRNAALSDAASINEDLIGFALEGNAEKVTEKVTAMRKVIPALRSLLDASTLESLTRQFADMEQASTRNDVLGVALASVEVYRFLENATDPASRPAPLEVAMLDYSGFKLSILSRKEVTDWQAVAVTAKDSDAAWVILTKRVQEASLRNLVAAIQDGLRNYVERKDVDGARFAAKMQIEVVDVLEDYFKRSRKK